MNTLIHFFEKYCCFLLSIFCCILLVFVEIWRILTYFVDGINIFVRNFRLFLPHVLSVL